MKNGLYKVEFKTPMGVGAGVVLLQDGQLRGGDSGIFYAGSYTESENRFSADVRIDRHTTITNMVSVFGIDRANIHLTGTITGDTATMTGTAREAPGVNFQARMAFLTD